MDDLQDVTARARRVDDALRAKLQGLDTAARVAKDVVSDRIWPVVGVARASAPACAPSPTEPRTIRSGRASDRPLPRGFATRATHVKEIINEQRLRLRFDGQGRFLAGVLCGAAVGAALGVMFAPRAGAETRRQLAESSGRLRETANRTYTRPARA